MAASIESFVRRLLLRHHLWQALGVLLVHALVAALALLAVDALVPWASGPALWAAGAWLSFVLLRELLRLLFGRRHLQVAEVDAGLAMHDMLTTLWLDRRHGAFSHWLRRDVAARLAQAPPERRRHLWWGPCRRAMVLLPLVLLLIWLGPLGNLLPVGLKPAGDDSATSSQVAKNPGANDREGEQPSSQPGERREEKKSQPPEQQPAGGSGPGGEAKPPPGQVPPKPLIAALPVQKEFVVPTWIHEGPSTKGRAPVVDVPQPGQQQTRQQRPERQPPRAEMPRAEQLQEFQRAAEQAQHARHVPPAERPFVRRYFAELVASGRTDGGRDR